MKFAVNSQEMKRIDEYTIQTLGISQSELMERAADAVASVIIKKMNKSDRILVVCGPGNNGGDGIAAGRILYTQGYHVAILFVGDYERASEGFIVQMEMARKLGMPFENQDRLREYNIVIDAIFGIGLARPVSGYLGEIIECLNKSDTTIFSVDIPSGISADNGRVMGIAVHADYTITFGYHKLGILLYPGADYAGQITVADIGFPEPSVAGITPEFVWYEAGDIYRIPPRKNYSNKGTYGKVLIIAGSKGMSGAAYLSAKAAYRCGAGLVKILTAQDNRIILQTLLPEALYAAYDEPEQEDERAQRVIECLSWADVIVIGPGIGLSKMAETLLKLTLEHAGVPVVVDADAITLLSKNRELMSSKGMMQLVLTPHLKELSRLIDIPVSDICDNLVDTARQCSYNNSLVYVIKDARTIVTQGDKRYINSSGNNGMATGGSGDVLTGIIAALIGQGMQPYDAACLSVYIHGLAGDIAAKERGKYSMMAGDIVASIETVLKPIS